MARSDLGNPTFAPGSVALINGGASAIVVATFSGTVNQNDVDNSRIRFRITESDPGCDDVLFDISVDDCALGLNTNFTVEVSFRLRCSTCGGLNGDATGLTVTIRDANPPNNVLCAASARTVTTPSYSKEDSHEVIVEDHPDGDNHGPNELTVTCTGSLASVESEDGAALAMGDPDGDGPGESCGAPETCETVPAVSEWGVVMLMLFVMIAGTAGMRLRATVAGKSGLHA